MSHPKTLALLTCYICPLPWYFNYFVHSCKYNPGINFFVISDDAAYEGPLPSNVRLVHKSPDEISLLATGKLGFEVNITRWYKLCDFKPAYDFFFSELLHRYNWGRADLDVIFGNIRNFMTDDLLESYDLISVRPDCAKPTVRKITLRVIILLILKSLNKT
jgi:hypothetical protein